MIGDFVHKLFKTASTLFDKVIFKSSCSCTNTINPIHRNPTQPNPTQPNPMQCNVQYRCCQLTDLAESVGSGHTKAKHRTPSISRQTGKSLNRALPLFGTDHVVEVTTKPNKVIEAATKRKVACTILWERSLPMSSSTLVSKQATRRWNDAQRNNIQWC
jgi:hypothetical protein